MSTQTLPPPCGEGFGPDAILTEREEDRKKEEKLLADQEREADAGRGQRAREKLEMIRSHEIQQARKAAGLCLGCGRRLGAMARWFGVFRHLGCKEFTE